MVDKNEHHELAGASAVDHEQPSPVTESVAINHSLIHADPWQALKAFTQARIALGRVGSSLPTSAILDFNLAHAMARDAVHLEFHVDALETALHALALKTLRVKSRAHNRASFLLRPDWGRQLSDDSIALLQLQKNPHPIDFLIVIGDGLSSMAVHHHAALLVAEIQKNIPADWVVGDVVIAEQARVALADDIAEQLNAKMVAIIIGERPGLSSPDSLGIYLTYNPHVGCHDAERNCISNIHTEGLSYALAAKKLLWLANEAVKIKASGVMLKDESVLVGESARFENVNN